MMQASPIPAAHTQPFPEVLKPIEVQPGTETKLEVEEDLLSAPSVSQSLTSVDRLLITKRLALKEMLYLRGKKNTFYVRTPDRNLLYTIEEENKWWSGYIFYGLRPFQLHVSDSEGREVMRFIRPFACTIRLLPWQLQKLHVEAPPGNQVGSVEQQWTPVRPLYLIKNKDGADVFWLRGPFITVNCFKDVQFQIMRVDGTHVGATCKRWQGLTHAMFVSPVVDRFGVAFERNLTDEEKTLVLAATLLMDYMYYDA